MTVQTEDGLQKIRPVSDLGPHMKVVKGYTITASVELGNTATG